MQNVQERYAEFTTTEMTFARIRVTIEHPAFPQSFTTAMHIPEEMADDFIKEHEARKRYKINVRNNVPEHILRAAWQELNQHEARARETRQLLSNLVTRSLSDAFAAEVCK